MVETHEFPPWRWQIAIGVVAIDWYETGEEFMTRLLDALPGAGSQFRWNMQKRDLGGGDQQLEYAVHGLTARLGLMVQSGTGQVMVFVGGSEPATDDALQPWQTAFEAAWR